MSSDEYQLEADVASVRWHGQRADIGIRAHVRMEVNSNGYSLRDLDGRVLADQGAIVEIVAYGHSIPFVDPMHTAWLLIEFGTVMARPELLAQHVVGKLLRRLTALPPP